MLSTTVLVSLLPAFIAAAAIPNTSTDLSQVIKLTVSGSGIEIVDGQDINAGAGKLWIGKPGFGGPCAATDYDCHDKGGVTGQTGFTVDKDNLIFLNTAIRQPQQIYLAGTAFGEFLYNRPQISDAENSTPYMNDGNDFHPLVFEQDSKDQVSGIATLTNSTLTIGACPYDSDTSIWLLHAFDPKANSLNCKEVQLSWSAYEGVKPEQFD